MIDLSGQEHMIMTFYVQGRPQGEIAPPLDSSYLGSMSEWIQDKFSGLSELSFDEAMAWLKQGGMNIRDKSIRAFKYLSGAPLPPIYVPSMPSPESKESAKKEVTTIWSVAGMFSSLKAKRTSDAKTSKQTSRSFTEGEVHADLVKNKDGYFEFRYLLVDIPSSCSSHRLRCIP
jgi:import inner membrane translocase subunit TIM21